MPAAVGAGSRAVDWRPGGLTTVLKQSREAISRRKRLIRMCRALPEVENSAIGHSNEHVAFRVRRKIFAYYLFDHHGDGRIALCCKAVPGDQGRLVEQDSRCFFLPPYLGPRGWVGVRLDLPRVDWGELAYLIGMAYRLSAPRALVARLDDRLS